MKYLDITLRADSSKIIYPEKYQEELGNFAVDHLYYDEAGVGKLLLVIPDKDFVETMVRTDVVKITETQAKAISESKEARIETVKDEVKLRRLELKAQLGNVFSQEELDCIDPANPTSIFGTTKILADKIVELKAVEVK